MGKSFNRHIFKKDIQMAQSAKDAQFHQKNANQNHYDYDHCQVPYWYGYNRKVDNNKC